MQEEKNIKRSQELTILAGFLWLIGNQEQVEIDSEHERNEFIMKVEPEADLRAIYQ